MRLATAPRSESVAQRQTCTGCIHRSSPWPGPRSPMCCKRLRERGNVIQGDITIFLNYCFGALFPALPKKLEICPKHAVSTIKWFQKSGRSPACSTNDHRRDVLQVKGMDPDQVPASGG